MAHILVIEDEADMRRGLVDNLHFEGHTTAEAADGKEGLALILSAPSDLILLDVMMPGINGFDVCRAVRAQGIVTPIIMLTAKGEEIDRVLGLELGADDYMTKPFSLRELLARVKAVLRRTQRNAAPAASSVSIGNLLVNFHAYSATAAGRDVALTHKEYEVLRYLYEHRGQTVSRDQLLQDVWGYDESISSRSIDNFILKLRQKIEDDPAHPRCILTVHGIGYKLIS
ncbi:MAG: response regulator transcription factor [Bacteroidetes bacterium]|nr:response regulator transcription factor [Bacteroidota bacterium]